MQGRGAPAVAGKPSRPDAGPPSYGDVKSMVGGAVPQRIAPQAVPVAMAAPVAQPTVGSQSVELAVRFEMEITDCYIHNKLPEALVVFRTYTQKQITPSIKIYQMVLQCAALNNDQNALNMVMDDLAKWNLTLLGEQVEQFIEILYNTAVRSRVIRFFHVALAQGSKVKNPRTYHQLIRASSTSQEIQGILQEMQKNDVAPAAKTCYYLLNSSDVGAAYAKQMIAQHSISFSAITQFAPPSKCAKYAKTLCKHNLPVESDLMEKAITGGISIVDGVELVELWLKAKGEPSANVTEHISKGIQQLGDAGLAYRLWQALVQASRRPSDSVCKRVLTILSEKRDQHIFDVWKHAVQFIQPDADTFKLVLKVAADDGKESSMQAKAIWRAMQSTNVRPDEMCVLLLLKASSREIGTLCELYAVIRQSELPVPPSANPYVALVQQQQQIQQQVAYQGPPATYNPQPATVPGQPQQPNYPRWNYS